MNSFDKAKMEGRFEKLDRAVEKKEIKVEAFLTKAIDAAGFSSQHRIYLKTRKTIRRRSELHHLQVSQNHTVIIPVDRKGEAGTTVLAAITTAQHHRWTSKAALSPASTFCYQSMKCVRRSLAIAFIALSIHCTDMLMTRRRRCSR